MRANNRIFRRDVPSRDIKVRFLRKLPYDTSQHLRYLSFNGRLRVDSTRAPSIGSRLTPTSAVQDVVGSTLAHVWRAHRGAFFGLLHALPFKATNSNGDGGECGAVDERAGAVLLRGLEEPEEALVHPLEREDVDGGDEADGAEHGGGERKHCRLGANGRDGADERANEDAQPEDK
eukprot:6190883-Pleurochrysis_carterae.AAC.2